MDSWFHDIGRKKMLSQVNQAATPRDGAALCQDGCIMQPVIYVMEICVSWNELFIGGIYNGRNTG